MNAKYPRLEVAHELDSKPTITITKLSEMINEIVHEETHNYIQEQYNKMNEMIVGKGKDEHSRSN